MTLEVIGNPQKVFQYALNQNSITIDKIVITQEEFISKIANPQTIQALLTGCSQLTTENQFQQLLDNNDVKEALKQPINPEILKQFSQSIQEFFSSFDQVELQNYSFMNSMNSQTYTVVLRTKNNVIFTSENVEKNHLNAAFEEVLTSFFYSTTTKLSIQELEFQFEITKFEDMKKQFYLYKEGQKLELFATLAHSPIINAVPYQIKGEAYSSFQDKLFHCEAQLEQKHSREGVKMTYSPLNYKGKILEEQDLVTIHQATQNHNDIEIEGFISMKGKVEITSILSISKSLENTVDSGLILFKSSKKYEDISLLPFHDLSTQTPNPKYVLIRNIGEFKSLIDSSQIEEIDGLIISFSLFSTQLLALCKLLDIDCIITKNQYQKALQTKINWETLEIDTPTANSAESNPFSSLLPKKSQEEIQASQDMKRIQDELNATITKREPIKTQTSQTNHRPMSTSHSNTYANSSVSSMNSSNSEKKGALAMLADSVLNQPPKEEIVEEQKQPQEIQKEYVEVSEKSSVVEPIQPTFDMFSSEKEDSIRTQTPQFSQSSSVSHSVNKEENLEVKQLVTHLLELKQKEQELLQTILSKL